MPSTSKKQHNFMEAVAHNSAFAKKVGIPQSVGQDFSNADKGKTFKRGGEMATKMDPKMMAMMMAKKKAAMGAGAPAPQAPMGGMDGGMGGMKKGGMTKKMASGGLAAGHKSADGIASKGKTKGTNIAMKKGGKC
jgi:hypothetical protein